MIPPSFDYVVADSADAALAALVEHGEDAKLLAGGHSLIPLMKFRLAAPSVLVDIGRLRDLSYVEDRGDHVAIGALTRHRTVETHELVRAHAPLLAHVAGQVGDPAVRHRGTLGGSLAHGDPQRTCRPPPWRSARRSSRAVHGASARSGRRRSSRAS